jgi:hypothetical protein
LASHPYCPSPPLPLPISCSPNHLIPPSSAFSRLSRRRYHAPMALTKPSWRLTRWHIHLQIVLTTLSCCNSRCVHVVRIYRRSSAQTSYSCGSSILPSRGFVRRVRDLGDLFDLAGGEGCHYAASLFQPKPSLCSAYGCGHWIHMAGGSQA